MLKNYLLVTFRNLVKNSVYSVINIAGLSIGIACSILILLWVFDELSFDRFHPKTDRLFQVWIHASYDGKINSWTSVPLPTYEAMKTADSNIKNSVVADWGGDHMLTVGETRILKKGHYVSEEFLTMFEFPLVKGNAAQVLTDVHSIVISEAAAKALFGDADPINQVIRVDDEADLKVTGVLKNVPENSSFQFDCLLPWKYNETRSWVKENKSNWGNYSFQVFVELNDGNKEEAVEKAIVDMLAKHDQVDTKREFFLHPLARWRLHSHFENGKESGGMIEYVQMFTVIAIFILIIACINFMNLATARSERRAREVGIRKSVGSRRFEIIFQFLGESLLISFLAFVIAVLLAELLLPAYNNLVDKHLFIAYNSASFWIFAFGLIFFTGIISGSYPAFYLSSFQPSKVLKGKVQVGKSASLPRKILVTLQFGFSILLIIGTLVIYRQIEHVKSRDLGYSQKNLITVDYTTDVGKNYKVLKQELLQSGAVSSVTKSNSPITGIYSNNFLAWPGMEPGRKVLFATIATEYDYTKTMGIKLVEGRDFSEDFKSDTAAILVNKAAMDIMQLKNPLGAQLDLWDRKVELIGIVDNVLMGSPEHQIGPMFIVLQPEWISAVSIRLAGANDLKEELSKVEAIFKKYNPAYPFEYTFVDVEFQKKFTTIAMTSKLASLFASLAIFITGLGLFGLAAFTAEQRTKEIGIRKVLGASVGSLVGLMSKDFSRLVIIAFVVAAPVAWWLLNIFLERYQYRISIPWWVFPFTGFVALAFALIIVSTQAMRAARSNPVNSLRNE
ncbi:ABC transporter permease [Chryseolinea lacunae]|uniref:ABC transporter permease n=1 Tax=Chryseolinea lacunae TaxID=2801331 RepID=A0ABS1KYP8_9BACT|nr:ABC transporter permease [Chryseolinea lacunae]MBL0744357.1 ABC transporter permease [Chryseolinea lacunae]